MSGISLMIMTATSNSLLKNKTLMPPLHALLMFLALTPHSLMLHAGSKVLMTQITMMSMVTDTTSLPTPLRRDTPWMTGALVTFGHLAKLSSSESVSGVTNTDKPKTFLSL